ncbi:uncharacterized protein BP5553_09894 [Venustampulla echinocandica]|uniref:Cytochrome P450 n=1 Tax=Venustampulla echinocandica TaxID=2656787 RepID=A0A370TAZ7_9HELO|nr:uncharacterized protein BP5553_09894 [Venustampulla echinocandica]RDL31105.1 hypothetical protein BP5553_09894 [Venustampulla echinocandica]
MASQNSYSSLNSIVVNKFNEIAQKDDIPWRSGIVVLVGTLYVLSALREYVTGTKVPLVGRASVFEPLFISNFRFLNNAQKIVGDGYAKFKNRTFKYNRADGEILVLPARYVNDLRNVPRSTADQTRAQLHNFMGHQLNLEVIIRNKLYFRVLQEKVTPNLNNLTAPMQDELNYAMANDKEFPMSEDEWMPVKPSHMILDVVARISARIFVGLPMCRNKQWLEISIKFTESIFLYAITMRLLPFGLHKFLSLINPNAWKAASYVRQAKQLLVPEVERRGQKIQAGEEKGSDHQNILSWMIEIGKEDETSPSDLAHLEVILSMVSIHALETNVVQTLYDLGAHPEYIQPLREEILQVIKENGPWMQWKKTAFVKLRLLDSLMKESQRLNPPNILAYHRMMRKDLKLSDGTVLRSGSHTCMAINSIQNDPENTSDPEVFDGYRYYTMRKRENEEHLHQFATTDPKSLHFGHGIYACPGRFFASLEIKIILIRLIMDYDFKFPEGQGRPENLTAYEYIFPNPEGVLLMKRRKAGERLQL